MANMSYCRFENTYHDFCDCLDALEEHGLGGLSDTEMRYAKRLYENAKCYIDAYEQAYEDYEDEEDYE